MLCELFHERTPGLQAAPTGFHLEGTDEREGGAGRTPRGKEVMQGIV